MVKELREMTDAGMMECKKALVEADGDMEKAVDVLRTRGLAAAAKKAGRATNEGTVMAIVNDAAKSGAVVELNCETDFVGMNDKFKAYAEKLGRAALAANAADVEALRASTFEGETVEEIVTDAIHVLGENIQLPVPPPSTPVASPPTSTAAARSACSCSSMSRASTPRPTASSSTAATWPCRLPPLPPVSANRESVPAEVVGHEMGIYMAQAAESGKPEAIQEKIAVGRLDKFYKENCLAEQDFVKNPDQSINQYTDECAKNLGGTIKVTGFVRWALGETA